MKQQGQFPGSIAAGKFGWAICFKVMAKPQGDYSGNSVSAAGDINGDGYTDLLVGAYYHASSTGRSYVVFGGPGVGNGGNITRPVSMAPTVLNSMAKPPAIRVAFESAPLAISMAMATPIC